MNEEEVQCPFCDRRHRVRPPPGNSGQQQKEQGSSPDIGEIVGGAAIAAGVAGLAAPLIANAGLSGAGFSRRGVKLGSVASKIQSGMGSVPKGSAFSKVQSLGAKGGFSQFGWLALGGALVAGAAALGIGAYHHSEEARRQREEEVRIRHNICLKCWEMHKEFFMAGER